jgi:hypothetical protein
MHRDGLFVRRCPEPSDGCTSSCFWYAGCSCPQRSQICRFARTIPRSDRRYFYVTNVLIPPWNLNSFHHISSHCINSKSRCELVLSYSNWMCLILKLISSYFSTHIEFLSWPFWRLSPSNSSSWICAGLPGRRKNNVHTGSYVSLGVSIKLEVAKDGAGGGWSNASCLQNEPTQWSAVKCCEMAWHQNQNKHTTTADINECHQ